MYKYTRKITGKYNGEIFNDIKCDCKLQKRNENYYLVVPEKIKTISHPLIV